MTSLPNIDVKSEARRVIDSLPDGVDWEDVIYALYVRERVEKGLDEIEGDDLVDHDAFTDDVAKDSSNGP